jgi:hypothetical protein
MRASLSEFPFYMLVDFARKVKDRVVMLSMDEPFVRIIFQDGEPSYAIYRKLKGDEAFIACLFQEVGEVEIKPINAQANIKGNIVSNFDSLMNEYEMRKVRYEDASHLVPDVKMCIESIRPMDPTQTLKLNRLQWKLLIMMLQGLSLEESARRAGVSDYLVKISAASMMESRLFSLAPVKEEKHGSIDKVAAAVEVPRLNEVTEEVDKEVVPDKSAEQIEHQPPLEVSDQKVIFGVEHQEPPDREFELLVQLLPITGEFFDNPDVDDNTIVINLEFYNRIAKRFGSEFDRCVVMNTAVTSVPPVEMKVYRSSSVEQAAMSAGALFRLKVWSGSVIRIIPVFSLK